ncbi:suppressor of fused domain protein [Cytophagaceae bacterium DM2B3-1]|uniref:Suppressor of fused domain protein n=1 Tax=Xanthocytophaga flava TaxID=3048013 RepID=A0ABT7CTP4_9BACT|nr:suppressor of fused domain protein [Xanthocytophaga flavus]MDJ1471828.1 suppressor of fused domain protein [Xanthocytophaga flavus]MDJ1497148.1 suppressor of fused domain protein [Xanthocytophaga flavus]
MPSFEELTQAAGELRNAYWQQIGELAPDVISHLINPAFMGGPAWPALRQAFAKITTPTTMILASDGLSDPYSDVDTNPENAGYNGLGLEMYVETPEILPTYDLIMESWQFDVLYQVSQLAAQNGNLLGLLNKYQFLTTEIYANKVPDAFRNSAGRVGVILGLPSDSRSNTMQGNLEEIRLVNTKLLTLDELEFVLEKKEKGRMELAELLIQQGNATLSDLTRKSVV